MWNAATENLKIKCRALTLGITILVTACGGNNDSEKAGALLSEAEEAYNTGRFEVAMTLLDSIKNAYPHEIDIRRSALHLATKVTEGLTLQRLQEADSLTAVLAVRGDSLQRLMKFVPNPIEGYYVAASADPVKFLNSTGLQARVSPDGDFYLISSLRGKSVKSTSVTVAADGENASTSTISFDGERNDRSMGGEVITFLASECDSLGRFVASHSDSPITLTFVGATNYSMSLPASQANEIALLYDYSTTVRRFKVASLEKERLSRAVDIARDQAARTFVETSEEKSK